MPEEHKNIDPQEFQERIDRLTRIFGQITRHAQEQALLRCPYKNQHDRCTARFGCRYKRPAPESGELPICTSDDKLDYRTAWEENPDEYDEMKDKLKQQTRRRKRKD